MSNSVAFLSILLLISFIASVYPDLQRILIYKIRKPIMDISALWSECLLSGVSKEFIIDVLNFISKEFKIPSNKIRPSDSFFWILSSFPTVFDSRYNDKMWKIIEDFSLQQSIDLQSTYNKNSLNVATVKDFVLLLWKLKQ